MLSLLTALPLVLSAETAVLTTERFEFHSNELVNLHHFLYEWARASVGMRGARVDESAELAELAEAEREAWTAAYEAYLPSWVRKDLLFDRELDAVNKALRRSTEAEFDPGVPAELAEALRRALPVYREHWWERHDRTNREWISALEPILAKTETEFAKRLAAAYGGEWQDEPMRVDLTHYGNWAGAYTTHDPNLVTITSADPENAGHGALEVLFHEASHAEGLGTPVFDAVAALYEARDARPPKDLWHATFFYTAGELTRDLLREFELAESYATYGERNMWKRVPGWAVLRDALELCWRPYLDGEWGRDEAYERMADELSSL